MRRNRLRRRPAGASLVEALAVVAITAVVAAQALPLLRTQLQRRQLEGAAALLETDLQLARAEAVAANEALRMDIVAPAQGGACIVLHDGRAGACTCGVDGLPACARGVTPRRHTAFPADGAVALRANVRSIAFDPVLGTVSPTGTLRLSNGAGELRLVINVMGRVRDCSVGGALPGHRAC